MAGTLIGPVVDEGLGNSAYLVDLGDGRALAVDVPRDLRAVRAAAGRHGLTAAFAADTHLHADFLSGALQLASAPTLSPLTPAQFRALQNDGGLVIDVRPVADYAAGHIPGSLAIPLREAFATWLGWLVPGPATPLVIVAGPGQDLSEVIWQALKIGYGNLAGTLAGGVPAWEAAGHPAVATALLTPGQVDPAGVVDVRQAGEYAAGHLPGARNIELGALTSQAASVAGRPVVTMCGHGERAATAASVLERAGHTAVAVLPGGPPEWADATGGALERGT